MVGHLARSGSVGAGHVVQLCLNHLHLQLQRTVTGKDQLHQPGPLVGLDHGGRTQARFSVNAAPIERAHEAGTSSVDARLAAARTMAEAGYPVGLVVAPIVFVEGWEGHYADLLDRAALALRDAPGLTFELITHRFTPGSKATLASWYPGSTLDMGEDGRAAKRGKFGALKYVYAPPTMRALRAFFSAEIARRLPAARVLYWT